MTPSIDDPRIVAFAQREYRFIAGSREMAERTRLAVRDLWWFVDDGPDMLERNHRISRIKEPSAPYLIRKTESFRFSRSAAIKAELTWGAHTSPKNSQKD
jgi:hypothetical protein